MSTDVEAKGGSQNSESEKPSIPRTLELDVGQKTIPAPERGPWRRWRGESTPEEGTILAKPASSERFIRLLSRQEDASPHRIIAAKESIQTAWFDGEKPSAVIEDPGVFSPDPPNEIFDLNLSIRNPDVSVGPNPLQPVDIGGQTQHSRFGMTDGIFADDALVPDDSVEPIGLTVRGIERNEQGEVSVLRLRFFPERLGDIDLRIAVENGVLQAHFVTQSEQVRALVEATLPDLKEQLQQQGLSIENLSVGVGEGDEKEHRQYASSGSVGLPIGLEGDEPDEQHYPEVSYATPSVLDWTSVDLIA